MILALGAALVAGLCLQELWWRHGSGPLILAEEPLVEARRLVEEQRWAEARWIAQYVRDNPALGDVRDAEALIVEADAELDSLWRVTRRLPPGAVTGERQYSAGLLGKISVDLFVIGGARELLVQEWKEIPPGDGDELVAALSAEGLASSVTPEIGWVPALAKALRRNGALTPRFALRLTRMLHRASRSRRWGAVTALLADLGRGADLLGPGPLAGVMRSVDTPADLAVVVSAAEIAPRETYVVAHLFGRNALRRLASPGGGIRTVTATVKSGGSAVELGRSHLAGVSSPVLSLTALMAGLTALLSLRLAFPRRAPKATAATM